jgi:hypothetical protein
LFLVRLAVSVVAQKQRPKYLTLRITKQAGFTVSYKSSVQKKYIIESVNGEIGFTDCDNDGRLDIITLNG